MIYSEYLGMMIPKGFTLKRVYIDITSTRPYFIKGCKHYTWNEDDLVYYNDDIEDEFFMISPVMDLRSNLCYQITSK